MYKVTTGSRSRETLATISHLSPSTTGRRHLHRVAVREEHDQTRWVHTSPDVSGCSLPLQRVAWGKGSTTKAESNAHATAFKPLGGMHSNLVAKAVFGHKLEPFAYRRQACASMPCHRHQPRLKSERVSAGRGTLSTRKRRSLAFKQARHPDMYTPATERRATSGRLRLRLRLAQRDLKSKPVTEGSADGLWHVALGAELKPRGLGGPVLAGLVVHHPPLMVSNWGAAPGV